MAESDKERLASARAELADLRAQAEDLEEEANALRRRLQDAPKRVRTLEERLLETKGQLAQAVSQNEKLSYTLREARDHIAALREEVEKLTQPPSAYGTVAAINDDETVDVYSGGRKMRVAVLPDVAKDLRRGAEVVLNESLNVVLARGTELTGEVVTIKEVMEDGRALIVGRADEERVCDMVEELASEKVRVGRLGADGPPLGPAAREAAPARGRGAGARGGARHQLRRRRRPRRPDRADRRRGRAAVPAPGAVRGAPPPGPEGHPPLRPAGLRQDAHRQGGRQLAGQEGGRRLGRQGGPQLLPQHQGPRAAQQVRRRDRAADPARLPAGPGEVRGGLAGHRLLRRDGLDVPHPRHRHQLGHGVDDRAAAPRRDRRRRDAEERHRDRRLEPRGPHRPGHPPPGPARREDQDRAPQRDRRGADLRPLPHPRPADRARTRSPTSVAATPTSASG